MEEQIRRLANQNEALLSLLHNVFHDMYQLSVNQGDQMVFSEELQDSLQRWRDEISLIQCT